MPCARSAFESFVHLFKGGGVQRQSLWPPAAAGGTFLCSFSAGGGLRGNPRRGFPLLFLHLYVCADTLGEGRWPVLPFDPISLVLAQRNGVEPPKKSAFLPWRLHHSRERVLAQRNGVEPPKKSAFLPWRLHHSRERCCLGYFYSSSPDLGRGRVRSGAGKGHAHL